PVGKLAEARERADDRVPRPLQRLGGLSRVAEAAGALADLEEAVAVQRPALLGLDRLAVGQRAQRAARRDLAADVEVGRGVPPDGAASRARGERKHERQTAGGDDGALDHARQPTSPLAHRHLLDPGTRSLKALARLDHVALDLAARLGKTEERPDLLGLPGL